MNVTHRPICILTETQDFPSQALTLLSKHFDVVSGPFTRSELLRSIKTATGLFVRLGHKIDRELMEHAPNLKFIASPTTGLNHIDLEYAAQQSIEVLSLKGEETFLRNITATAELTWGLALSLVRAIPAAHSHVLNHSWDRDQFKGQELNGKTLGIIGLGRLGQIVAQYALAFRMKVIACDHKTHHIDGVEMMDLDTVCQQADILSLHATSTPENYHLINDTQFSQMKPSALFINTARGDLVDEKALLSALHEKRIAGAALDVLEQEYQNQVTSSPDLIEYAKDHRNLILTPHIGGATFESMEKTAVFIAEKVLTHVHKSL